MSRCSMTDRGHYVETVWCPAMQTALDAGRRSFRVATCINPRTKNFSENVVIDLGKAGFGWVRFCPFCGVAVFHDEARPRVEAPDPSTTATAPATAEAP